MDIIFYNNISDPNTINKVLTEVTTLSGELKTSCDIISPNITISNHGMMNANYCYIPEFGRYYFIVKQTILTNNVIEIDLNVDVLESFKTQILALSCILENSTTDNDNYLSGPEWVTSVKTTTHIKQFPSGLNNSGEYILITAGG